MAVPSFVARTARRLVAGGLLAAAAIWLGGEALERVRLGADLAASRARLHAEVAEQFRELGERLDLTVRSIALDAAIVRLAERGDAGATRTLFDQAAAGAAASGNRVAVTIVAANNQPVAWVGRSEEVPDERLTGPASLFLLQSTQGLQLIRVQPVVDGSEAGRHIGAIVAEASLARDGQSATADAAFSLETSIAPAPLRLQFEGAADAGPDAFIVRSPSGEPLAAVEVPDAVLHAARGRIREQRIAAELALLAVLVLLATGPLLDWRRVTRSLPSAAGLTLAIALLLVAARAVLWIAVRRVDLASPPLTPAAPFSAWSALFLASPIDFMLTSMLAAALLALGVASFGLWRSAHRRGIGVLLVDGASSGTLFLAVQFAAGSIVIALLVWYEAFLRGQVSQAPIDILRFAIDRSDWLRLHVVIGLLALNAVVIGLAVLVLLMARSPWAFPRSGRTWRRRGVIAWLAPALFLWSPNIARDVAPLLPTLAAAAFVVGAALVIHHYRATLRHSSQAARLLAAFLAMVLPSVVLYPSLVDAASRAKRQLVESRYAPEVMNQRQDVRLKLQQALVEIDRIQGLDELVRASDPPLTGPPPTDAAFLVWSQTSLASQRMTSSVELHNASGAMVSRFAMKLPEESPPQPWSESACAWEILEEVSPLYSEERRLLHAGRAICMDGPNGRRSAGSIVVHAMLDYGNLLFISAQNPYVALIRSGQARPEPRLRADVDLYVYGWSRRVLYNSGPDAPALTEPVFRGAFASRAPFWSTIDRESGRLDVYVMNDRAALYVLGMARQTPFGHLVAIAELVTLVFIAFVVTIAGGMLFNLAVAQAPASGRALLDEVRASFYRKLFLAFVAAAIIPVLALALVSRAYIASLMFDDIESEATRIASVASRVVEDFGSERGQAALPLVDDNLVVWLSRVIAQDVNIFDGPNLLASSERNLFASGLLPSRTPGDAFRAILLDGRPAYVGRETVGGLEYLIAAAPVHLQGREAVLTVPLASRQQETQELIEELDRRVLLAALLFIMLGASIGYYMAERIADPVNRLMRATRRIARGDLDARVLATSSDELRRLVDAFNQMAADLQRQRKELERTNRLAAWADMARQVAHDIKNPLTPIQLNAEHLRRVHVDQGRPMGGVIDECVSNILGQVRLLRQISSEFSSFASSPEPKPVETNLTELVTEVVEPYRSGLAGRVAVVTDVPLALPRLRIDRMLIGRALTNVIENALHAMPGGGTLTVEASQDSDRTVQLRVTDTGVGMDGDALAKIFEPYFSTKAIGTGLGLTIAKRNVEANHGTIAVTSEKGKGTRVTMTLPIN
ncbi:MAG: ATP-binding protein [Acidobacteriota bacterium]|nr:ATP-binding protein [Acidobacteriota bacterium]